MLLVKLYLYCCAGVQVQMLGSHGVCVLTGGLLVGDMVGTMALTLIMKCGATAMTLIPDRCLISFNVNITTENYNTYILISLTFISMGANSMMKNPLIEGALAKPFPLIKLLDGQATPLNVDRKIKQ